MLGGAPGGGKSLFALNWAWKTEDPLLYLAQDSPRSVLRRLTALALGQRVSAITEDDIEYWASRVHDLGKRQELVVATGAQTVEEIGAKITALTEWLMEPPTLVVIDNLFDMRSEGNSYMSNEFYADLLPNLKQLAIERDVGLLILHHVTRGDEHGLGTEPLRLKDLLFAGEREAGHVWGIYRPYDKVVNIQVLKNRDGAADPRGKLYVSLDWQPESGTLFSR